MIVGTWSFPQSDPLLRADHKGVCCGCGICRAEGKEIASEEVY